MLTRTLAVAVLCPLVTGCQPITITDDNGNHTSIPVYEQQTFRVETSRVVKLVDGTLVPETTIQFVHLPSDAVAYRIEPTTTLGPNTFSVDLGIGGNVMKFSGGGNSGVSDAISAAAGAISPLATVTGNDDFRTNLLDGTEPGVKVYWWDQDNGEWVRVDPDTWE